MHQISSLGGFPVYFDIITDSHYLFFYREQDSMCFTTILYRNEPEEGNDPGS